MKTRFNAFRSLLILAALTLTLATSVQASILFSNLSQPTNGSRVGGINSTAIFGQQLLTDNHSYTLNSVNALLARPGINNPVVDAFGYFYLADSVNLVGQLVSILPLATSLTPTTLISISDPIQLLPNSSYWLIAFGATDRDMQNMVDWATWGYTDSSAGSGPGLSSNWMDLIGNITYSSSPFIMQVDATQNDAAAVPEPSTYALFCIGLGVLGYARKKMGKREE